MIAATWGVFAQLAPWLLLGMLISGLLHVLVPSGIVRRKLRGTAGVFKAVVVGVPLPLCSCGVIPAGIGLKKDGASDGAAVGFLISTPQTGVDSVLVTATFLGWPFALFKVFSAAVTGVLGGILTEKFQRSEEVADRKKAVLRVSRGGIRDVLDHGIEVLRSIWIWLVIGVIVSAAIELYAPRAVFEQLSAWGSVPASLAALVISLPLYVCATASVPIAASLVHSGLPAGAALVFLMAGPATNVATIGSIFKTFGARVAAIYLSVIIASSIGFAAVFDQLIQNPHILSEHSDHVHVSLWSHLFAGVLLILLVSFVVSDVRQWVRRRQGRFDTTRDNMQIGINGMTCQNCADRIEKALRGSSGVEAAKVDFASKRATVQGTISEDRLQNLIAEIGFEPHSAQRIPSTPADQSASK